MISKNKILKAIQEGVLSGFKFASNDATNDYSYINFEDSKVDYAESFNIGKLEQDFVDLGLPSRLKWAKFNIGATCANDPISWYGDYYEWGEIKNNKDLSSYEGNCKILLPKDDIVTLTYYGIEKFRIPTKEDWEELRDNTYSIWEINYKGIKGLNGLTIIGNENSIFIPAGGFFYESVNKIDDTVGILWSSTLASTYMKAAYNISFKEDNKIIFERSYHNCKYSVRGVCEK